MEVALRGCAAVARDFMLEAAAGRPPRLYAGHAAHAVSGGVEASTAAELAAREAEKEANLLPGFRRGIPECCTVEWENLVTDGHALCDAGDFDDREIVHEIAGWAEHGGFRAYGVPLRRTYDESECGNAPMSVDMLKAWHTTFSKELTKKWVDRFATRSDLEAVCRYFRVNRAFFVPKMSDSVQKTKDGVVDPATGQAVDGVPQWRLCEHMSSPRGESLNEATQMGIEIAGKFKFQDVDDAAAAVQQRHDAGRGVELWKADESGAYRNYPIACSDRPSFVLFGLDPSKPFPAEADLNVDAEGNVHLKRDQCCYMMRNTLPFGWAKSVAWYWRTARLVQAAHLSPVTPLRTNVPAWAHTTLRYIDDTLGVCAEGWGEASKQRFIEALVRYNIPLSLEKDEEEGDVASFKSYLGILIDSVSLTLAITPARLREGLARLRSAAAKAFLPRKELESLCGVLSFCAKCTPAGRTFMRRMFDSLKRRTRFTRLSRGIKADIAWWLQHWESMNGVALVMDDYFTAAEAVGLFTDSSLTGFGASFVFGDGTCEFFGGRWKDIPGFEDIDTSQATNAWHISELEAVAAAMALHQWSAQLARRRIVMRIDNDPFVVALNSGRCRDPGMMCCIRDIWHLKASGSFDVRALHIRTKDNVMGDAPSRWTRGDGSRDPKAVAEFFAHAHQHFGLQPEDMVEVCPSFDTAALLRRIQKSHGSGGAARGSKKRGKGKRRSGALARAAQPAVGSA